MIFMQTPGPVGSGSLYLLFPNIGHRERLAEVGIDGQ